MDLLEDASKESEEARIRLVSRIRELANREKASRGQVEGIARGGLWPRSWPRRKAFQAWAAARPEEKEALAALDGLQASSAGVRAATGSASTCSRKRGPPRAACWMALTVTRWALERDQPDAERAESFQDRNLPRAREEQKRDQKTLHLPADRALMTDYLEKLLELPEGYRVEAVERRFRAPRERAKLGAAVAAWLGESRIHEESERLKMLEESSAQLRERHDPLLDFAFDLNRQILAAEVAKESRDGLASRLRPVYRRALARFLGRPLDADANGTQRVSFAKVAGYAPRDGLFATPRTTFRGLVAKNTGQDPSTRPRPCSPWPKRPAPAAGRIPSWATCRSISWPTPTPPAATPAARRSTGQGRLVGLNFDRVWENVANDFGYNPEVARNICVDIRYVLFLLENLGGEAAKPLLDELGVR